MVTAGAVQSAIPFQGPSGVLVERSTTQELPETHDEWAI
jgi:hypothetical protein